MTLIVLCMLFSASLAAPAAQSLTFHDDGSYHFYYQTGEEGGSHTRSEVRHPDGVVIGKFSYQDPDGEIREVNYRADESGYVAEGDVGVKGAPKGQFPVAEEQSPERVVTEVSAAKEDNPAESSTGQKQPQSVENKSPDLRVDEEEDKDELQDLAPDETAALDDQPEGFPPGFFLEKFQGLRRLPEPTKKESTTTEQPKSSPPTESPNTEKGEQNDSEEPTSTAVKSGEPNAFTPWKPFQGLSPNEWASTMYHQPVYVFAYNHPDSYGYHYFF